jgi:hypothetical protein
LPLYVYSEDAQFIFKAQIKEIRANVFSAVFPDEIKLLGLLVEQYLAFAETMAQQQTPMYMTDWIQRLDSILQLNGRELLTHAGKISHEIALQKSGEEFEKYKDVQKAIEKTSSIIELENDIQNLKIKTK